LFNICYPFSYREKVRMRGYKRVFDPLTPTLSLKERELTRQQQ